MRFLASPLSGFITGEIARPQRRPADGLTRWTSRPADHADRPVRPARAVAFVPGGYGGIGEAIAWSLAQAGARVAVAGRSAEQGASRWPRGCASTAAAMRPASRWTRIRCPTSARCVDAVAERFGAHRHARQLRRHAARATPRRRDRRGLRRGAAGQPEGRDVPGAGDGAAPAGAAAARCTCCRCARSSACEDRGYSAYCATKGALVMLVKQHAVELARHGITVNGVAPTVVRQRDGAPLARRPAGAAAGCSNASRSAVSPSRRTWSARRCSSAARRRRSSRGRSLYVDGGLTATQ